MANGWKRLQATDPPVVELSELLQLLPIHPEATRNEKFRNPNGVARKTFDIASRHPDYQLVPSNGSALDREVLRDFLERPDHMAKIALLIRQGIAAGELQSLPHDVEEEDDYSAPEGRLLVRRHISRERNKTLRKRKIDSVLRQGGQLSCEACGFNFEETYGDRGSNYIECHHIAPLHEAGEGRTGLGDLALICSNCHRMIHRRAPWPTPKELRTIIETRSSQRSRIPTQQTPVTESWRSTA
ncbi:HNH endonuclease [Streptomyces griseoluteus]|uniref:HNH endonuclease n=1 Tax=Streptomyces griseoluteus TaxID=29306 RepID=UPI0036F75C33